MTRRGLFRTAAGVGAASAAAAGGLSWPSRSDAAIVHPGMLHTQSDFDRMYTQVHANAQPWLDGWNMVLGNSHSAPGWAPNPQATIYRGSGYPENYSILYNDIAAAYQNALRYKVGGATACAQTAVNILNAWAHTLTLIDGSADKFLAAGIYGYEIANAAEIMRGYSGFDLAGFQNLMRTVFYPLCNDFLVNHNGAFDSNYWASWDLCVMNAVLAIGIVCDDQSMINQAVTYFSSGVGMGSLPNAIPYTYPDQGLAQWVESGRDQGHTILGIGLLGSFCEMAWHQGYDLYGASGNVVLAACEYVARYNLGEDVPFTSWTWHYGAPGVWEGWQTFTAPSTDSRGQVRPVWALIANHFAVRKGLFAPNSVAFAKVCEPEGGGGNYESTSGGYDHLGFGTLTATQQARTMLPVGSKRSFQSVNYPARWIVVESDSLGYLDPVDVSSSATVKQEATFTVVAGLASAKGYSFQASDGRYLRHSNFRLRLDANDGTDLFHQDATFYAVPGSASGSVRLVSYNYPGRCVRHYNYALQLDPYDLVGNTFQQDSSFNPLNPWA